MNDWNGQERRGASAIRRHRRRIFALFALVPPLAAVAGAPLACSTGGSPRSGSGLLVAPMQSAPSSSSASIGDAGADAAMLYRPVPSEPRKPRGDCERSVDCIAEQAETPAWPFAPPFTQCAVSGDKGGAFNERETRSARRETADACCYVSFQCEGSLARPSHPAPPTVIRGRRLEGGPSIEGSDLSAMLQAEHQSVIAFRALARDLAIHGAPPELVAAAFDAAEEEAGHVISTVHLAGLSREPIAFDDRAVGMPPPASLAEIVRSSFLDGCAGEGAAALSFEVAAESETETETRRILAAIAEDEARHAELGWRTLIWAIDRHPVAARAALASAMAELRRVGVPFDSMFLDAATAANLADDFAREVLFPLGEDLLAIAPPPSPLGDGSARAA